MLNASGLVHRVGASVLWGSSHDADSIDLAAWDHRGFRSDRKSRLVKISESRIEGARSMKLHRISGRGYYQATKTKRSPKP